MIRLSKVIQKIPPSLTMVLAARAKEMKSQGIDVISFTVGEPDFDTPAHIKDAAKEALDAGFTKYTPAEGIPELRQALVKQIKEELGLTYDWKQTVVTNGSKQAIYNFFQVALEKGDEVIIPAPYWLSYPSMVELAEGVPKIVRTTQKEGFKLTPQKLKKAITRKTKALIINSPSNPTGATYSREELRALAKVVENKNIWILSDDAYYKIIYDGLEFCTMAQLSKKIFSKTVLFRTCSKSYAMTGWRVGFVAGPLELIKAIGVLQSQSSSGVNAIAQKAAVVALSEAQSEEGVKAMTKAFYKRRTLALKELAKIPDLDCFRPEGAFYLFVNVSKYYGKSYKGNKIKGSVAFSEYLLDKASVVVIPGKAFGADKYIRLSFATSDKIIVEGISRIAKVLKKLK